MVLLEFAYRLVGKDPLARGRFEGALRQLEPRYFVEVPDEWNGPASAVISGRQTETHLLAMMFDLVRNGKAHEYQSTIIRCPDGRCIDVDIAGPRAGREIRYAERERPPEHLDYKVSAEDDLSIYIRPDQLFLDIKRAIQASGLVSPSSNFPSLRKGRSVTVDDLRARLERGGFRQGCW